MLRRTPKAPSAETLAEGNPALLAAIERSRKMLKRRAWMAAAAGSIPIPGLDWAAEAALLSKLIPKINTEFGLSPQQLDALTPEKRESVQKAVALVGTVLIGKLVTREMLLRLTKAVGLRLTTAQAAKFVPIAGQAVSAALGYATLRYLGEQHLRDCVRVVQQAQLALNGPDPVR